MTSAVPKALRTSTISTEAIGLSPSPDALAGRSLEPPALKRALHGWPGAQLLS
jgi:hypothetical protein